MFDNWETRGDEEKKKSLSSSSETQYHKKHQITHDQVRVV